MNDARQLAVFARIASRPIPRVVRMARVARNLGYEVLFCGAFRDPDLPIEDQWQGIRVTRLGRYFPLLAGRRPWTYLRSVLRYNCDLYRLLRSRRPRLVHASDIETMPASILYRKIHGGRLLYNIHDNLAQRYEVPAFIRACLNLAEACCVRLSDVSAVPEEFRRDALPAWCRSKVTIIRNTPGDIPFVPPERPENGRIRVFFGGWLDWGRGLRSLFELAARHPDLELRVAGEGSEEVVREIQLHRTVTFLGFLDHEAVLEETRRCHIVPALYDPARAINRFAASNKLAEALAIGRPVLLNSEMRIAQCFSGLSCAIITPYAELSHAWSRIETLMEDWPAYLAACHEARLQFERHYDWEPVRQAMIAAVDSATGTH